MQWDRAAAMTALGQKPSSPRLHETSANRVKAAPQSYPRSTRRAYHARIPLHQGSVIDPSDCVERERRPEGSA